MSCYLFMLIASWIAGNYILHRTSASGIVVSPRNQTVKEGDDAFFNCTQHETNGSDISGLRYSWRRRNNEPVLSNTSRLNLKNVNRTDAGIYICTVTNVSANWSDVDNATLHVSYSPVISYWIMNRTVNESSRTSLFCNATGYPAPRIQWNLTDGSSVTISNIKAFDILNVSRSQHGRYSCQAYNDAGSSNPKFGYLNVQYKPKINRTGVNYTFESWLHRKSTFTCQADGNPSPVVSWSRGLKIAPGSGTSSSSRIFVSPKSDNDFGFYICTAWNALGKDEFRMELNRSAFRPDQPDILNEETNLTSPILKLIWKKPNPKGRPIFRYYVWQRQIYPTSSGGKWTRSTSDVIHNPTLLFNITLKWDTTFEIAVTAENDQGVSRREKVTTFIVLPEPTTKTTIPPTSNGLSNTVIAGIAAGGGVFLLLIIFMSLLCARRRRREARARPMQLVEFNDPRSHSKDSPRSSNANTYNNEVHKPRRKENAQHIYTNMSALNEENPEWEYPREKVRIEKYIGKGAFGVVAKAFVDDLGIVAVKIPKVKATETNKEDLLAEYELMKQLQHPNIIRLMGGVTLSDPIMVMFEYIPYGDLLGFLKRSRGLDDQYFNDPDIKPTSSLTSEQLLKFAGEIADGMAYLEARKIIHRDLAARNVLVGEEETCKITDFGMARDVQQNDIYFKRSRGRLPVKWTAIESLLYGICTTQSDVWSYGIVLYEIFTIGGKPYPDIQGHRIPYMLKDNYRMPQPVHLDDEIYALMCECWQNDPNDRPTFEAISSTIRRLQRCHKEIFYMNVYDDNLYGNVEDLD
ncbi:fibroblast growth factor receptor 2-like [Montipora capricornis]|uniref:fibroblast growth factor receptor 2-like n=1 Tax=Montipora capricornis TaxID=246305 RepID=UPI0035F1BDE3